MKICPMAQGKIDDWRAPLPSISKMTSNLVLTTMPKNRFLPDTARIIIKTPERASKKSSSQSYLGRIHRRKIVILATITIARFFGARVVWEIEMPPIVLGSVKSDLVQGRFNLTPERSCKMKLNKFSPKVAFMFVTIEVLKYPSLPVGLSTVLQQYTTNKSSHVRSEYLLS